MADMTVEQALAELRQMFPSPQFLEIESASRVAIDSLDEMFREAETAIIIGSTRIVTASTLPEAMVQIRAWKEANNG